MCCPELCHLQHGPYTYEKGVYADDGKPLFRPCLPFSYLSLEEYFADVARIYQEEINDLYTLGCRKCIFGLLSFVNTYLAFFPSVRQHSDRRVVSRLFL